MSTVTRAPTARRSCSVNAAWRASLSGCADGDLGGDLAAPLGELAQIGLDHRRHRKEPPVARHDAEKIAGQRATTRRARRAPPPPCPARRATGPGCAAAARDRRSPAASRAIRADRRRPRRARAARRPDRTAPPHNAQPGRKRLSFRKPMESGPQSARRRRTVATNSLRGKISGASARSGPPRPREIRAVRNTDGPPAQPPAAPAGAAQFQRLRMRQARRGRCCGYPPARWTAGRAAIYPKVLSCNPAGEMPGRRRLGENVMQGTTVAETGFGFTAGHDPLSMAGVFCRMGRLDARRRRFRPLFAGASAGIARVAGRQPDARPISAGSAA